MNSARSGRNSWYMLYIMIWTRLARLIQQFPDLTKLEVDWTIVTLTSLEVISEDTVNNMRCEIEDYIKGNAEQKEVKLDVQVQYKKTTRVRPLRK